MSNRKTTAMVLAAVCAFASPGLMAGSVAGNGGALEVTQWFNGGLLGKQLTEVALTAKTVVSTLTEVQNTYLKAVQQGAQLLGVGDLLTAIREIEAYKNQVNRVVSDVKSMGDSFSARSLEASLANMTFEQYVGRQAKLLKDGDASVKGRIDRERDMIETTNADIALAKKLGDKIAHQEGLHQSVGLMNSQMNALLQTNIRIADALKGQSRDKTGELIKEQVNREEEDAAFKLLQETYNARRKSQIDAIDPLKTEA